MPETKRGEEKEEEKEDTSSKLTKEQDSSPSSSSSSAHQNLAVSAKASLSNDPTKDGDDDPDFDPERFFKPSTDNVAQQHGSLKDTPHSRSQETPPCVTRHACGMQEEEKKGVAVVTTDAGPADPHQIAVEQFLAGDASVSEFTRKREKGGCDGVTVQASKPCSDMMCMVVVLSLTQVESFLDSFHDVATLGQQIQQIAEGDSGASDVTNELTEYYN